MHEFKQSCGGNGFSILEFSSSLEIKVHFFWRLFAGTRKLWMHRHTPLNFYEIYWYQTISDASRRTRHYVAVENSFGKLLVFCLVLSFSSSAFFIITWFRAVMRTRDCRMVIDPIRKLFRPNMPHPFGIRRRTMKCSCVNTHKHKIEFCLPISNAVVESGQCYFSFLCSVLRMKWSTKWKWTETERCQ